MLISSASGANKDASTNGADENGSGEGWPGSGEGPEGLEEDPVLQDFFMGMGSSGSGPGEKPSTASERLSPEEAAYLLSMGTWRLRPKVGPIVEALVAQIEGAWRVVLGSDIGLYDIPRQYRYMDSADPGGSAPFAHQLPDPDREDPSYPRLQVENRAYRSYTFRKLHLEVAIRQDGLQVVHCVMYPKPEFDLPILSLDLVANGNRVTLAIVDPCPVSANLSLPPHYANSVKELQIKYGVESNRGVPEWGSAIFSQFCVCIRPTEASEVASFLKYAIALANFHMQIGRLATPVAVGRGESEQQTERRRAEIKFAHQRYCQKQLENDKTRKVLEKSFGSGPAEEYMRTVMFDC